MFSTEISFRRAAIGSHPVDAIAVENRFKHNNWPMVKIYDGTRLRNPYPEFSSLWRLLHENIKPEGIELK